MDKTPKPPVALTATTNTLDRSAVAPYEWVLDSGASSHISPYDYLFCSKRQLNHPISVTFGNKEQLSAEYVGDIAILTTEGPMKLTDVLYVPGAACNLLPVRAATSHGATVEFKTSTEGCIYISGNVVAHTHYKDGTG